MSRQLSTTRPFRRGWSADHNRMAVTADAGQRPGCGGALVMAPFVKPTGVGAGIVFAGMDPSDPSTYIRPWRPQPGMVARLNFDGAQVQDNTETGGLWGAPAWADMPAGGRPARRPRLWPSARRNYPTG
jgi:hypothetical protein